MYSSRGNSGYGQQQPPKSQPYSSQSAFGQNSGPDGASHLSMASRPSSLLGSHPSSGAYYGGQYASMYGSTTHNSAIQVPATSATKGAGSSVLEGRSGYALQDSPKYKSGDYSAAVQKHGQKGESMFSDDRLTYAERASAYSGRDLQNDSTARFTDSIAFGQHQTNIYDRLESAAALRQELLLAQSLQSTSVDGISRQADYLAARSATARHAGQEVLPYDRRFEADLHALSSTSGTQHAPSILGAHPRREVEDLMHQSPRKEKRRDYVCKVYSANLVDTERDYLSMDKRYHKLFVSPKCSKVVVNRSREGLSVPFKTPVSLTHILTNIVVEHDFVQEETSSEHVSASTKALTSKHVKLESGTTIWNAKFLLMSGLSHNSWEELSSERKYQDRIPRLCNMLRFAFIKNGNSFMAIGGSWDPVDGSDPLVDKSSLIQTATRYAKELTGLDLKNCRKWNPFLEVHYDRIGNDGLFSHKEITVLYIPDLSDSLPSIDAWRDQWLAHKKAIAERECLHALKREKWREKKEVSKDKEPKKKDLDNIEKTEKKNEAGSASKVNGKGKDGFKVKAKETGKDGDKTISEKKNGGKIVSEKKDGDTIATEKKDEDKVVNEKKDGDQIIPEKKDEGERVTEGNISGKKNQADNAAGVQTPGSGKMKIIRKVTKKKVVPEKEESEDAKYSGTPLDAKISTMKKAIKKTPMMKIVKKEDEVKEPECYEDKTKSQNMVGSSNKATTKKKIIKKVTKKKVAAKVNKDKMIKKIEAGSIIGEQHATEPKWRTLSRSLRRSHKVLVSEKIEAKEEKKAKVEGGSDKNEKLKDGKEKKDKAVKTETKVKEVKDKRKVEEPPRHPGFILQTKGSKNSKLRSLSLSLDSLLDYTDKDIEESTFELSVFAETFYEMLQFQMGSRTLTFLQFVTKRNRKKRQREEASDKKEKDKTSPAKKSSPKRQKTDDVTVETPCCQNTLLSKPTSALGSAFRSIVPYEYSTGGSSFKSGTE
ncbi:hypothetical protein R6Q57_012731 [Mikania cordata]